MVTEERVAQSIILTSIYNSYKSIAIICPRMDMCKRVLQHFYKLHNELPEYLQVKLTRRMKESAELENGTRIILMSNSHYGCGVALSTAYVHNDFKTDESIIAMLLPSLLSPNNLIWFN